MTRHPHDGRRGSRHAHPRQSRREPQNGRGRLIQAIALAAALSSCPGAACPFCGVVGRSLADRRDTSDVVAVGAADAPAARDSSGLVRQRFTVATTLRGRFDETPRNATPEAVTAAVAAGIEGTALLFGVRGDDGLRFDAVEADETVIGHVAAAPPVDEPASNRLQWFATRLEHPDPTIAADAFTEFGLAPFTAVRDVARTLDAGKLVAWLREPAIDQRRRGFYGLAVGLAAAAATDPDDRDRCIAALHEAVEAPANDLRAGFDGVLAGVLVAEAEAGLAYLEDQGLLRATTRPGDARHALAALRFAWESLADTIPRHQTAAATAALLGNPPVTAESIIDLARYGRWDDVAAVAAAWDTLGRDDPLVRRAVAGYLRACPLQLAQAHRLRLEAADPVAWARAESAAMLPAR